MSLVLDHIPIQAGMPPPPPPEKPVLASSIAATEPLPPVGLLNRQAFVRTYREAMVYFDHEDWDRAGEALKRVIDIWSCSSIYVLLGYTYFYRGDFARAASYFVKATKQNPQDLSAHFSLAIAYNRLQKTDKAISAVCRVIRLYRENPHAHFLLGYLHHQLHQWNQAENAYREALKLREDFPEVYQYLALMYFEIGNLNSTDQEERFRQAIATYQELIEINSGASACYINIGYIHEQLGEPVEAKKAYQKAVKFAHSREDLFSIVNIGMELLEVGRYEEARTVFKGALHVMRDNQSRNGISRVQILTWIGTADLQLDNSRLFEPTDDELLSEAEDSFLEALAIEPNYIHAQVSIGAVYYAQGRIDEAINAFDRALEIAPDNKSARANLMAVAEEKLQRRLHEMGLLKRVKKPITDFAPYQNRTPIAVRGKPVSETILEDRR